MSKLSHGIYVWSMVVITVVVTIYIGYVGWDFYSTALEERFYHEKYEWFKPSGLFGQGIGIIGTLMMLIGVVVYILRKKYGIMERYIRLKYLLEFHIFLCTLGPILVLYHTTFKFGGIVSIAFWSMVAVVLSGVIGRFIYIQIPRTIDDRELSMGELKELRTDLIQKIQSLTSEGSDASIQLETIEGLPDRQRLLNIKKIISQNISDKKKRKELLAVVKQEITLSRKIGRLAQMQKLFKYWHVAHRPFAIIMLIVVVIHVAVAISFGYTWIF